MVNAGGIVSVNSSATSSHRTQFCLKLHRQTPTNMFLFLHIHSKDREAVNSINLIALLHYFLIVAVVGVLGRWMRTKSFVRIGHHCQREEKSTKINIAIKLIIVEGRGEKHMDHGFWLCDGLKLQRKLSYLLKDVYAVIGMLMMN